MKVTIKPSRAVGRIFAPPSKSAAHRALIAAALSDGCTVSGVGESADMDATLRCLAAMGAEISRKGDSITLGHLNPFALPATSLDCGESGSTLRFLLPLCLLSDNPITLTGRGRLLSRPMEEYKAFCARQGCSFVQNERGITVCGPLLGNHFEISAEKSSQFVTGLLFLLPLIGGTIRLVGKTESASYILLTEQILGDFGITIQKESNIYKIQKQSFACPAFSVEGDWSNAAFPAALSILGGKVEVLGLRKDSTQGDRVFPAYFDALGNKTLDLTDCPDLAPVLFALAAVKGGDFVGCHRLRLKESDRIAAMEAELKKCGITLLADADSVSVSPKGLHPPTETIYGHNDHRIVMAMAVLLTYLGGSIEGAEAVEKSWRDFWDNIKALGIEVE